MPPFTPAIDMPGPYRGTGDGHSLGAALAGLLERVMSGEMSVIRTGWDRAAEVHYAGHMDGHGHGAADRHWLGLRAAFPSALFRIEHATGRDDPGIPPRAAVRWSLQGRHDGPGAFGAPSGAEVHVMGITHAEMGPWGLRREWTLIDETAIWKQLLLAKGDGC